MRDFLLNRDRTVSQSNLFALVVLLICGALFACIPALVRANTSIDYFVVSGIDTVSGSAISFSTLDVTRLEASDNNRKKSSDGWPSAGSYDENKYLEFVFSPSVPSGAVVSSAVLTHEWRNTNTTSVGFAKLEVWDGAAFAEYPVTASVGTSEITETTDISSYLDTPAKVNALKVRFLAYRNTAANAETSHDLFKLTVTYSVPAEQTIGFEVIADKTYGDAPFEIHATSTSELPVTFEIVEGPATLEGSTVTVTGAGSVTIRASQSGNESFAVATSVDRTFTVAKAVAEVILGSLGHAYDGTAKSATATTSVVILSAIALTYNGMSEPPIEQGSYEVAATLDDPNYEGSATSTLVIHTVVPPSADVVAGSYTAIKDVSLAAAGSESIRYTTDGSVPSCTTGNLYTAAIPVAMTRTIKTLSCYSDNVSSEFVEFAYTIALNIAPGDMGSALSNGVLTLPDGAATSSTPSLTAAEEMKVTVSGTHGSHSVTLPRGVIITPVSGGTLDASLLSASMPSADAVSGFDSGKTADGVLQWGISGESLQFSEPITLNIFAGTNRNGEVLYIERSVSGTGGWTSDGIVAPATCTVSSGACSFQATKASYYGVFSADTPVTATPASSSHSNGGVNTGSGGKSALWEQAVATSERLRSDAEIERPSSDIAVVLTASVPADIATSANGEDVSDDTSISARGDPVPKLSVIEIVGVPTLQSKPAPATSASRTVPQASGNLGIETHQFAAVGTLPQPFTVTGPTLSILVLLGALGMYAILRYP